MFVRGLFGYEFVDPEVIFAGNDLAGSSVVTIEIIFIGLYGLCSSSQADDSESRNDINGDSSNGEEK